MIIVNGKLQLWGPLIRRPWSTLKNTVGPNDDFVSVNNNIEWPVDSEILISTSTLASNQDEVKRILGRVNSTI